MKIIHKDIRKGEIKVKAENLDDLWYLSSLIEPKDLVKGMTLRKIKIGSDSDRNAKIVKKKVFMTIEIEKIDYDPGLLRVSGKTVESYEEIPKGSYHTFNIEESSIISITKEKWMKYQLDKLNEAVSAKQPNILICILDREEAIFALSKRSGYDILTSIQGDVQKKEDRAVAKGSFYQEIIKILEEYAKRYKIENIIVASPAFWKEELLKHIKDEDLKKKIFLATCSSVSENAINEVLRRPEVQEVLRQDRIAKETYFVDSLLAEIKSKGAAVYGMKDTEESANSGAVKTLLVTDSFIHNLRTNQKFGRLDSIMKLVDSTKGEIHIITSQNEAGKRLDGLGGIGAILRYKLEY